MYNIIEGKQAYLVGETVHRFFRQSSEAELIPIEKHSTCQTPLYSRFP
jgi:hypothetical protein